MRFPTSFECPTHDLRDERCCCTRAVSAATSVTRSISHVTSNHYVFRFVTSLPFCLSRYLCIHIRLMQLCEWHFAYNQPQFISRLHPRWVDLRRIYGRGGLVSPRCCRHCGDAKQNKEIDSVGDRMKCRRLSDGGRARPEYCLNEGSQEHVEGWRHSTFSQWFASSVFVCYS